MLNYVPPEGAAKSYNESGSRNTHENALINGMINLFVEDDSPSKVEFEVTENLEVHGLPNLMMIMFFLGSLAQFLTKIKFVIFMCFLVQ